MFRSHQKSELRAESGARRDAARRQLSRDVGGAGSLDASQPLTAHHAAPILRPCVFALYAHVLRRGRS